MNLRKRKAASQRTKPRLDTSISQKNLSTSYKIRISKNQSKFLRKLILYMSYFTSTYSSILLNLNLKPIINPRQRNQGRLATSYQHKLWNAQSLENQQSSQKTIYGLYLKIYHDLRNGNTYLNKAQRVQITQVS